MTLRIYLDEDSMDQELVRALRARGIDVATASEANMVESSDADQLRWVAGQDPALVSFNVGDFLRLHALCMAEGETHAGLVLMRQQRFSSGCGGCSAWPQLGRATRCGTEWSS